MKTTNKENKRLDSEEHVTQPWKLWTWITKSDMKECSKDSGEREGRNNMNHYCSIESTKQVASEEKW